MSLNTNQKKFVSLATQKFGEGAILTRKQLKDFASENNMSSSWLRKDVYRVDRGQYQLPVLTDGVVVETPIISTPAPQVETPVENTAVNLVMGTNMESQNLVPSAFDGFVAWGHHATIKKIVQSKMFYPVFITGLSGNGKTLMVEQIHASLKKELIRVNITIETDEDDLLGGFRLVNGETKFVPGPVVEAMERGCTLLLDECDLGSNKLLALQPVLEGKGVYLKKVNKWITPKEGFNVIATANTKGKGSEDGRFIGTNILNEAFLERFAITIEQPYPSNTVEKKIVLGSMKKYGSVDENFADNLVTWTDVIRKTFYDGGVDEIISTRRLVHITQAYAIFDDKMKAIKMCTNRFDDDTKNSFIELYTKVDAGASAEQIAEQQRQADINSQMNDNDSESDDADSAI